MNLEELLEQAVKNADKRVDFINALINSEVFVLGTKVMQKNSDGVENEAFNMFSIKNNDSKDMVPFFTSDEKLKLFASKVAPGEPPYVKVRCIDFLKLASNNNAGVVLNLNSQYCKEFSNEEVKALLNSLTPGVSVANASAEGNVIITLPKTSPETLLKGLTKFFCTRLDVLNAFVFDITYPNQKPHTLFVIDSEFNRPELFEKIDKIAQEFMADEKDTFDIMPANEALCQSFIKNQTPFYSKFTSIKK